MKPNIKKTAIMVVILAFIIGLALNAKGSMTETIKLGGAFALTGDSSITSWGEAARNGALLAVEDINNAGGINGKKVELVIEDIQSTSRGSLSAVTKLITVDRVAAIVGPTWLDVYQGAENLVVDKNIMLITPDGGIEAINGNSVHENVLSTWYRTDVKAKMLIEFMAAHGVKRLAALYANDSYYTDLSKRMEKYAKINGIQIIAVEKVSENATDIRTLTLKIKDSRPDAIFFGFYDEKNIYNFLKIHRDTFPEVELYSDELVHDHYAKPEYKGLYEGVVYYHASNPNDDFVTRYKARFYVDPMFGAGTAYDATMIIAKTLREKGVNSENEKPDYDTYLRSTYFDTVSYGRMTFDEIGGVETENNQFDLWQVQDSKIVKVN